MATHSPEGHHAPVEQQPAQPNPAEMQAPVDVHPQTNTTERAVAPVERLQSREGESMQVEQTSGAVEDAVQALKRALGMKKRQNRKHIPQVRDEMTVKIESIMEEGLKEAFQELTPVQAQEFKIKGEETALKIQETLRSTRVRVKKIFQLLFDWLRILPGVNRFFLEQEAKIKTDKIIALKRMRDNK